jgi:Ni/Co efflux regulator RcnB
VVRRILLATAVMAGLACATPATAQRVWQNGRWVVMPHSSAPHMMRGNPGRWGPMVGGRWEAGHRAPGGWSAYRRLGRGAMLPGYWRGSGFRVPDYLSFGLAAPPQGYGWVRYYDDAVLVDGGGRVWDSVDGIGWADAQADGYAYAESSAGGYPPPPLVPVGPDGYDMPPPPGHGGPMPYPAPYGPPQAYGPPAPCAQACPGAYYGGTFYGGSAQGTAVYTSGGYGASTTTVVIAPPPVTTTTVVEEVVQEEVVSTTYVRKPRRVYHRAPVRRAKPRCCVCGCR